MPVGLLTAIYLAQATQAGGCADRALLREGADRVSRRSWRACSRYGAIVLTTGGFSALAGAAALSILMLPTIILTSEDAIRMVPARMKDAAIGMGATNTQVVWMVLLPTAMPGILTGVMLAVARAAGETAPLLFTALFSNYWLWSRGHANLMQPTASLAVLDLQLRGHARSRTRSSWRGPPRWCSCCLVLAANLIGQSLSSRQRPADLRRSRMLASAETSTVQSPPPRAAPGADPRSARRGARLPYQGSPLRQLQGRARYDDSDHEELRSPPSSDPRAAARAPCCAASTA
mgnify:CR=1 FL=1